MKGEGREKKGRKGACPTSEKKVVSVPLGKAVEICEEQFVKQTALHRAVLEVTFARHRHHHSSASERQTGSLVGGAAMNCQRD